MDVTLIILGSVLMIAGLAGCVLPFLPGPPLCYAGLLIQQFQETPPYSTNFLVIWAILAVVVTGLDYVIPIYGTRKYGGTKYGMWGCAIGLIVGIWLGPLGIILGPFVGAFIAELIANSNSEQALKAAWGSFVGFLLGTLLKLIACFVMIWYFIDAF